jgi:hypothetical protein
MVRQLYHDPDFWPVEALLDYIRSAKRKVSRDFGKNAYIGKAEESLRNGNIDFFS